MPQSSIVHSQAIRALSIMPRSSMMAGFNGWKCPAGCLIEQPARPCHWRIIPSVGIKHLRALRELLKCAAGTKGEDLIEMQHLDSSREGDADEKKEKTSPHATQSVSVTSGHAALAASAPRSATESLGPARATVARRDGLSPSQGDAPAQWRDRCTTII